MEEARLALRVDNFGDREAERRHLRDLYLAGLLVGKSIVSLQPIDEALETHLYDRLRHGGRLGDDAEVLPGRVQRRLGAFFRGVYAIVPCDAFGVLQHLEIARLFECRLPFSVERLRAHWRAGVVARGSFSYRALGHFWAALSSLPSLTLRFMVLTITGEFQLARDQLDLDVSAPARCNLRLDADLGPLPILRRARRLELALPFLRSASAYRLSILVWILNDNRPAMGASLVEAMQLSLAERLGVLQRLVEGNETALHLRVSRESILWGTYAAYLLNPQKFQQVPWAIQFKLPGGTDIEPGQDQGGLLNEWMGLLINELLASEEGLLSMSADKTHHCLGGDEPVAREKYKFIGVVLGRALLSGIGTKIRLAPVIYHLMLTDLPTEFDYFSALCHLIPERWTHLAWLRGTEVVGDELGLSFALLDPTSQETIPLIEGGADVPVTEENKDRYIACVAKYALVGTDSDAGRVEALVAGFHSMIQPYRLRMLGITAKDLEGALYGEGKELSLEDWKQNTVYSGTNFSKDSLLALWFWQVLEELDTAQRLSVLSFCTGLAHLPLTGFRGIPAGEFTLTRLDRSDGGGDWLPEVATCYSQLMLYPYDSKEQLREKLLQAVELGGKGFGLA